VSTKRDVTRLARRAVWAIQLTARPATSSVTDDDDDDDRRQQVKQYWPIRRAYNN